jgi:hypothetical protein
LVVEGEDVVCWELKHTTCRAGHELVNPQNMKRILHSLKERFIDAKWIGSFTI